MTILSHFPPASASCFLFCDAVCGTPAVQPRSPRIVGGHESVEGSLPWTVMITHYDDFGQKYFICGGSIINTMFILTAAHCFYGKDTLDTSMWRVIAGKHSLTHVNIGEQVWTVEKIVVHPNFNHTSGANDIALMKVSQAIVYTDKIQAVCLPSQQEIVTTGQHCIVAGWGVTLETGDAFDTLNQVTVPVVSDDVCAQPSWQRDRFVPHLSFCAGYEEGGRDACAGDSGSPLVCEFLGKWFASGIVSLGDTCALPRKPGIYTNVSYYDHWIRNRLVENGYSVSC
ncbi:hypothetical protein BaRGS_00026448 [Batillaria attramentaria]|uniref:Peptidase S1 domain-containing protein n=1 Tax=Batillaria attramentaria TaxID=370345 RepID=A0ABD0K5U9_9CAEN